MKKMMKKTFSLLLIFMLAFTMIPTSTLKVSAKAAAATTQAKKATTKTAKKTAKKKKKTKAKKQRTVFIAAGHQQRGISSTERLAPGSSRRKAKLTSVLLVYVRISQNIRLILQLQKRQKKS